MSQAKTALIATIATLAARIAADTVKHEAATKQLEQFDLLDAVTTDSQVEFKIGRAETRRSVVGVVRAVKVEEDGSKKFKVEYTPTGDSFDNTFAVISLSQVERVHADEHGNLC
uniref:Uncharacterized protein n=1 Tax=Pseudomonas phage Drael01 TaxID=3138533 RepID=A0AAU6W1F4_9VIRU